MNYLQKPQAKLKEHVRNRTKEINLPLQLIDSSLPWTHIFGAFIGTSVIVENIEHANILIKQGYFGKQAWHSENNGTFPIPRQCHWKRRNKWKLKEMGKLKYSASKLNGESPSKELRSDSFTRNTHGSCTTNTNPGINCDIRNPMTEHSNSLNDGVVNQVTVINDSDEEMLDDKNHIKNQNPTVSTVPAPKCTLYLTLEEAFFLSFALYCLTVTHMFTRKNLNLSELWKLCNNADSNFVEKYVTYHYFRIRGWVVKSGLNFGCEFALYKRGPAFYHASCLVKIRNINHPSKPKLSWEHMMGYCRVSEAAKKDFVLCEVTWPANMTSNTCDIKDLSRFCVDHKLLQRWTASQKRNV